MNPQYKIDLSHGDQDANEDGCSLIISLLQKNRRKFKAAGGELLTIGYFIYRVSSIKLFFFSYYVHTKFPNTEKDLIKQSILSLKC